MLPRLGFLTKKTRRLLQRGKGNGGPPRYCPVFCVLKDRCITHECLQPEIGLPSRSSAGEGWSQSRVLPSAELAYETGLSAGSIAKWIPHPELHRARTRVPGECIADNALGASKMVGARRVGFPSLPRWMPQMGWLAIASRNARPRLPDPKSGGSAIPREPRGE